MSVSLRRMLTPQNLALSRQMLKNQWKVLPSYRTFLVLLEAPVVQGAGDGAEGITDLGSQQPQDSNHDDGNESEDNRILDEALAFFFRCKQHDIISFLKNVFV